MEKKRSKAGTIIGWILTVVGSVGCMYIIFMIFMFLYLYFFAVGEEEMGMLGILALPYFIPFPILLYFGIRKLRKVHKSD